jgi:hypothetical protein
METSRRRRFKRIDDWTNGDTIRAGQQWRFLARDGLGRTLKRVQPIFVAVQAMLVKFGNVGKFHQRIGKRLQRLADKGELCIQLYLPLFPLYLPLFPLYLPLFPLYLPLFPRSVSVAVFVGHQFDGLREGFVPFGESLKSFVDGHGVLISSQGYLSQATNHRKRVFRVLPDSELSYRGIGAVERFSEASFGTSQVVELVGFVISGEPSVGKL